MANFKDKMKNKQLIGKRQINSNEAIRLAFNDSDKKVSAININVLSDNPYQPRLSIDEEELENLSLSIKENGLLQPILVSPIENNPHKFYIVAGHRRVKASKKINLSTIDAIIYPMNNENLKIYSIVENLQREDLSALEEALAVKKLFEFGMTQTDIAKKISKSKSVVSNLLRITTLEKDVIAHIQDNDIHLGSTLLYEITNIDSNKQLQSIKYIHDNALNRSQVRDYVNKLNNNNKEKVSPAKLSSAFSFSQRKNKISFKLDLDKLEDKSEAIEAIENLLYELKNG